MQLVTGCVMFIRFYELIGSNCIFRIGRKPAWPNYTHGGSTAVTDLDAFFGSCKPSHIHFGFHNAEVNLDLSSNKI